MHIVIPLAMSDKAHLSAFLKNLRQMPPAPSDKVLIIPTSEVLKYDEFNQGMEEIRNIFGVENTLIKATPNTPMGGWPHAANTHFMWGCSYMHEAEKVWGPHPWMWLETDCRFVRPGWSESLQTAYRNGGKPFMGVEVPSIVTVEDKKTKVQSMQLRGVHLMGVAMYPPFYTTKNEVGRPRSGWKYPQKTLSFTIFCQAEHANFQRTKLIEHRARTCNWKRNTDGTFSCEDIPKKHPHAILYASDRIDLSGVVIVHGDKDGSLAELLINRPAESSIFVAEIKPDEALAQLDTLRKENERLKDENALLRDQVSSLEEFAKGTGMVYGDGEPTQSTEPKTIAFLPSIKMVGDALSKGSMTLQKLAEYFECRDIPAFEGHLNSIGYEAPKPHRRVRLIEATPAAKAPKKPLKANAA